MCADPRPIIERCVTKMMGYTIGLTPTWMIAAVMHVDDGGCLVDVNVAVDANVYKVPGAAKRVSQSRKHVGEQGHLSPAAPFQPYGYRFGVRSRETREPRCNEDAAGTSLHDCGLRSSLLSPLTLKSRMRQRSRTLIPGHVIPAFLLLPLNSRAHTNSSPTNR